MTIDFNEIFNDSYERVMQNSNEFFDEFYKNFIGKSEEIRNKFIGIDMEHQKETLVDAIAYVMSFYATKKAGSHLIHMAEVHTDKLKVSSEMYDLWMDSLIETLQKQDRKFDRNVELAWRVTLSLGIEFMKHYSK